MRELLVAKERLKPVTSEMKESIAYLGTSPTYL